MDNVNFHHSQEILSDEDFSFRFLPAYSPFLNPCEEIFSYLKSHVRRDNSPIGTDELIDRMRAAAQEIPNNILSNYYSHCEKWSGPYWFMEPHVVHYEKTFVYSTVQEMFKSHHEVSTRMYFIELMILYLDECQESSVPEIRSRPIKYIQSCLYPIMSREQLVTGNEMEDTVIEEEKMNRILSQIKLVLENADRLVRVYRRFEGIPITFRIRNSLEKSRTLPIRFKHDIHESIQMRNWKTASYDAPESIDFEREFLDDCTHLLTTPMDSGRYGGEYKFRNFAFSQNILNSAEGNAGKHPQLYAREIFELTQEINIHPIIWLFCFYMRHSLEGDRLFAEQESQFLTVLSMSW
ncbi:hypothetical protein RF11_05262 [Thelohanellus kitauei]|uniref:Tc1-like transposase DDE domain-containing protein n=1 Tax=Thelohanellus kitauei TaxID=669202 RepID=A0A0C2N1B9_THEKT|nr:hypothetical protein RF11_05262 [Thelohanellus kitauei]